MKPVRRSRRVSRSRLLLGLALGGAANAASAGDWQVAPSLGVTGNYTDNVFLASSQTQGAFYNTVVPGVAIRGESRRLQLNADYSAEQLVFYDQSSLNRLTHQLQGDLEFTVVPEHLFLDAQGAMFPALRSGSGSLTNRSRNAFRDREGLTDGDNNRADVTIWSLTPRYEQRFGTLAKFTASTSFSDTTTGNDRVAGAGRGNEWLTRLESGERFERADWGLEFRRRDLESPARGRDSSLQSLLADFGYQLNRAFKFTGSVGFEDNDFGSNQRPRQGPTGSVGFVWTPGIRTSLSASVGQRVFGMTKSFVLTHRLRHTVFSANYSEDLRTTSELLRGRRTVPLTDPFGNPLPIDSGINPDLGAGIDSLSLTDEVFVDRRFNAGVGYAGRRDQLSVGVYRLDQESTRSGRHETAVGGTVNWQHALSARAAAGISAEYQTRDLEQPRGTTDFYSVSPYLSRRFGTHTNARVSYSWMDSSSSFAGNSFTENAVQVSVTWAF